MAINKEGLITFNGHHVAECGNGYATVFYKHSNRIRGVAKPIRVDNVLKGYSTHVMHNSETTKSGIVLKEKTETDSQLYYRVLTYLTECASIVGY